MTTQLAYEAARTAGKRAESILFIADNSHQAYDILHQLRFFYGKEKEENILLFPDKEILPYDGFSPHGRINSRRIKAFYRLLNRDYKILIITVDGLMQRVPPTRYFLNQGILLGRGQVLPRERFIHQLEQAAYMRVERVQEPAEFAVRGSLLDMFPSGAPLPYRIDWMDDEIDTIRSFLPQNQRSTEEIESVQILPAHEFPLSAQAKERFRSRWQQRFSGQDRQHPIYKDLSRGFIPQGLENYLPFFFDELNSLFDYLTEPHIIFSTPSYMDAARRFHESIQERYQKVKHNPSLPPQELYLTAREFAQQRKGIKASFRREKQKYGSLPPVEVNFRATNRIENLSSLIAHAKSTRILLCLDSLGREELLTNWLTKTKIQWRKCKDWREFLLISDPLCIVRADFAGGLLNLSEDWALITESELFNERKTHTKTRSSTPPELLIKNFAQLEIGELVVHLDYGVGCFQGLKKLEHEGYCQEYLALEYAEETTLYVPVNQLHLVSRYIGAQREERGLDRLGTQKWAAHKARAARRAQDTAAQLLDIYARRAKEKGLVCQPPKEDYHAFVARFPYQETEDQGKSMNEVIKDMSSNKVMDRLVCGDVGFGKTEIAMRAAYLAARSGYQVAVLVPTTLLAQQHLESFKERFDGTPVRIVSLTRMIGGKEGLKIKKDLAEGKVDIIIGTHSLLSASVQFKCLGLAVIDEEHRFGVRQKERLKALRHSVEVLSLTATPIPRTLNLALSGLRDISLIASPPKDRLAVRTFVSYYDKELIKEAVEREMLRGGQIYYVFNNIAEIDHRADELKKSFPKVRIGVIHGSMPKHLMEKTMRDFHHSRFDLLICTTIIENGIDVPNANTLIIERADKFGLAQLHQLRGRVGRRTHQAYAYLLTEGRAKAAAHKRLHAIRKAEGLGLGFTIASYDLDSRGAGEILGDEQSGSVEKVGLELYTHLLERAVHALMNKKSGDYQEIMSAIELCVNAYLPDEYISDIYERLTIYKRVSNCNEEQLSDLRTELIDRFGDMPSPAVHLFELQTLRLHAQALGISKIKANSRGKGYLLLARAEESLMEILCDLVREKAEQLRLTVDGKLHFYFGTENEARLLSELNNLLVTLGGARRTNKGENKRMLG